MPMRNRLVAAAATIPTGGNPQSFAASTAASKAALSRTLRDTHNWTLSGSGKWPGSVASVRSRDGFNPNSPQQDAGMRIAPPPSLAGAIGTSGAAVAAAAPPDDPPAERAGSHGLRGGPNASGSVVGRKPYSGVALLPIGLSPAAISPSPCADCRVAGAIAAVARD